MKSREFGVVVPLLLCTLQLFDDVRFYHIFGVLVLTCFRILHNVHIETSSVRSETLFSGLPKWFWHWMVVGLSCYIHIPSLWV